MLTEERTMPATLVSTNGGIAHATVRTHPMPHVIGVDGYPFKLELDYFLLTGRAVYVGYYPKQESDSYE